MRRSFVALVGLVAVVACLETGLAVNKLCRHVGHVLFMRNQCARLSELNMCPQCRIRDTCCADSNTSCVIEHTELIGLTMFPNTTDSTRSSNCAGVSLRSSG